MDSLITIQHAPYRIPNKVRIESPIGAIEADTGSPVIDGITIVVIILVLYLGKKIVDKYFRR